MRSIESIDHNIYLINRRIRRSIIQQVASVHDGVMNLIRLK